MKRKILEALPLGILLISNIAAVKAPVRKKETPKTLACELIETTEAFPETQAVSVVQTVHGTGAPGGNLDVHYDNTQDW